MLYDHYLAGFIHAVTMSDGLALALPPITRDRLAMALGADDHRNASPLSPPADVERRVNALLQSEVADSPRADAVSEAAAIAHHERHPCGPYSAGGNPFEVSFGQFDTFAEALTRAKKSGVRGALITDAQGREVYARVGAALAETFTLPPV